MPIKLRFNGEDPVRGQVLDRKTPATFGKKSFDSDDSKKIANYDYYLYGYNVLKLQEGTTIAGAKIPDGLKYNEICEHIKPFRPFSLSSGKGLVSGCYYVSPKYLKEGDIIIDGAASRLFKELNLEGVKRLVRNMAVCLVNKWRTIAETGHYENMPPISINELPPIPEEIPAPMKKFKPIDLVFIYDSTKSTEKIRDLIKFQIKNAIDWFKETNADVKIAVIAFRDLIYAKKLNKSIDKNDTEYINFQSIDRADELVSAIESIPCQGGMGDGPEDWNSAFKAYFKLDFRKEAAQIIFFITDSGAHHPHFHSKPDNEFAAKQFAEGISKFRTDDERYSIDYFIGPNETLNQIVQLKEYIKKLAEQNPFWILCPFGYSAFYPMEKLYRKLKHNNPSTNCINITFKGYCPKKRLENLNKNFYKIIDIESDTTYANSRTDPLENLSAQDIGKIFEEIFTQTKLFIENTTMF
ncbi:hypothetical protein TVAG_439090 [Trichomonas vaginalis G3]|uniref:VWFA domain-containing protein n=1 Tax=Trichomonas vaginalis (strain ATCC PRA-98 / G3) TaxID=412133 RepID=A2FQX6_TRIV3|nr:nuclear chaperone required for maturation and nuclear export of pre-60s ribosome subunits [Trichomonas vaginalis G3]EAX92681.1 hypothetical protein TVAG_439090 [Trichomonas vaginalis G3]KAI5552994.1 nuclear chaperone required for maturation and nuclear export of pre-60s ribosome subunits [Trichomonas vaginalis G3]|eukprot:XP_001305611.1 hypothetical protein [Trichomonas vaginalis G3]